jgi:transposase
MPAPRKYPDDFRERAVRMVRAHRQETGQPRGGVTQVAQQLGVNPETLRNWVNDADVDDGQRPGVPASERARITELERENRELRRANEILKAASAFFARELDPRLPKS